MNKSKFLKKSLAMLLALMLVFAMIPLSASAVTTDYIEDLYVNGVRAANSADYKSMSVTVKSTTVGISAATMDGVVLYYLDDEGEEKAVLNSNIDLTDYEPVAENKYELTILAKVKENPESSDYKTVEEYPLTITVAQEEGPNNDTSLKGLANNNTTWANMTNYTIDNDAQKITVTFKFGYNGPTLSSSTPLASGDFAATAADAGATVAVTAPTEADSIAEVTVTADSGSTAIYDLYYEYEAAFESFTIPGQTGETEFVYNGKTGNQININVPYGYDLNKVVPTFTLVDGIENLFVYGGNEASVISKVTEVALTPVSGDPNKATATLSILIPGEAEATIALTVTRVSDNPEGVLKTIKVTDTTDASKFSNVTDVATSGTTNIEMPHGTNRNNPFKVELVTSANAFVVLTDANGNSAKVQADANGKVTFNSVELMTGFSFTVQVTPEDGGEGNSYNVVVNNASNTTAELKNFTLKDPATGISYDVEWSGTKGTITIPYSYRVAGGLDDMIVYFKASTGATITEDGHNQAINGYYGKAYSSFYTLLPKIDQELTYTVTNGDKTSTYTIAIKTGDARTQREVESVQIVGTNHNYEITENNTYKTETGEATLNGKKVRTIEVTVPYTYNKTGAPATVYFNDLTLSDGAKAYYVNGGNLQELKTIAANTTESAKVTPLTTSGVMNAKKADGSLDPARAWAIYVLSEDENVNVVSGTTLPSGYTDKENASFYYLVAKTAEPERGNTLESIESTLDPNITTKLEGNTITINVPSSYAADNLSTAKIFTLNFEASKMATVSANGKTLESDLGSKDVVAADDATEFNVLGTGKLYFEDQSLSAAPIEKITVTAEDGDTNVYAVKIKVNKPETGASITGLSVNGTAATIARDKIHVQLPLGSKLFPVSLDISASKMAKVYVDGTDATDLYDPDGRYDVNDAVKITVISEDGETTNTYTLTASVSEGFNDVTTDQWYYDEVMIAANAGWINGTKPGYFEPNGTMKRGDFAVIIARILGCDTEATVESKFPDCNETDYFNAAVTFCKLRGIIDGDDKGYFNPYDAITREEMAKILCNALELDELETSANPFDDDAEIAQWAKGYVNAVQAEGIMEGSNGSFNPRDNATRAEGAAVLVRAFANA